MLPARTFKGLIRVRFINEQVSRVFSRFVHWCALLLTPFSLQKIVIAGDHPEKARKQLRNCLGWGCWVGLGERAGGVEREAGTSCNTFALPACHSLNVVVK